MYKQRFLLLWGILHIILITVVSLNSLLESYYSFYDFKKGNVVFTVTNKLLYHSSISIYINYTGTNTGYGFFAPNVSSGFILVYTSINHEGEEISKTTLPPFKNKASIKKYSAALSMYFDEIGGEKDDTSDIEKKYINAVTNCMAKKIKATDKGVDCINVKVYLYDFPSLKKYRQGNAKPRLLLIKEINI